MRIHFFIRTLRESGGSGSHHSALSFIRALKRSGHIVTVHVYASGHNESIADIPTIEHGGEKKSFVEGNHYLAKILEKYTPEADLFFLYGHDFIYGGGEYRKRMREHGKPVVAYFDSYLSSMRLKNFDTFSNEKSLLARFKFHIYNYKRFIWDNFFGLKYVKYIDRFLVISPYMAELYARAGFPKIKFSTLPNFFEMPTTERPPRIDTKSVNILYTGRFVSDKGVDLLVEAVTGIVSKDWHLTLVGEGPLKERCEKIVKRTGTESQVTFVPWLSQSELTKEYWKADIFVHPCRWPETFARTIIEAIMWGVPAIVPRVGSGSYIMGDAGVLFSNGNVKELRVAIEKLLFNEPLRLELGEKAKVRARLFTKEVVVPQLNKIVERVVKESSEMKFK